MSCPGRRGSRMSEWKASDCTTEGAIEGCCVGGGVGCHISDEALACPVVGCSTGAEVGTVEGAGASEARCSGSALGVGLDSVAGAGGAGAVRRARFLVAGTAGPGPKTGSGHGGPLCVVKSSKSAGLPVGPTASRARRSSCCSLSRSCATGSDIGRRCSWTISLSMPEWLIQ